MIRFRPLVAALSLLGLIEASPLVAATPTEAVKQTADAVLSTLRDGQAKRNRAANRDQIKELLRARFDFEEMAKRSLGASWAKQSPEDQRQFTQQFTEMLMNTYIDQIDNYQGEKVLYEGERKDGNFATVETKIRDGKGQLYSIKYRVLQSGTDWKVFDVVIEDVSIVNNYRSQFTRLLNRGSFAELLQKLPSQKLQAPGAS